MLKILAAGGILAIATLLLFGPVQNTSKLEQLEKSPDRGKLTWRSQIAKAKGQQRVLMRASIVDYSVPRSFDDALANFHLIIAEPLDSRSYATAYDIRTWYKFRILEKLSAPTVPCTNCLSSTDPPPDLLPLEANEFLGAKVGGEVDVDGVRIISQDPTFPNFEIGRRYLLLVALDSKTMVGALRTGPGGAFALNSDERLEPLTVGLRHPFGEELSQQFGNSVAKLRLSLQQQKQR